MARANLSVSKDVETSFLAAQEESSHTRVIFVEIANEELVLSSVHDRSGSVEDDFNGLSTCLSEKQASLILFCSTDGYEGHESGKRWILVAWVPDGCRVRDKMLYSSSREDLKRSLGLGYFESEYAANVLSDITWNQYKTFMDKETIKQDLFTESERLLREEASMIHSEAVEIKSTAMVVLPFSLATGVVEAFQQFLSGEVNWLDINIEDEVIHLKSSSVVESRGPFQELVNENDARFLIARLVDSAGNAFTFFIFSCPEAVSIRKKMTMSSSKATVLAAAAEHGIKIDKNLEIRGAEEIDALLRSELDSPAATSDVVSGATGSAAASVTHSKPGRPGRGRARVGKFQADDA